MNPVPPKEEIQVPLETHPVDRGRWHPGEGRDRGEQLRQRIGGPARHRGKSTPGSAPLGQAFFAARAGAFSVFLLIRSMYFCCAIWSTLESVQYSTRPAGRFRNMNVNTTGMNSIIFA